MIPFTIAWIFHPAIGGIGAVCFSVFIVSVVIDPPALGFIRREHGCFLLIIGGHNDHDGAAAFVISNPCKPGVLDSGNCILREIYIAFPVGGRGADKRNVADVMSGGGCQGVHL